ncbi:MAG: hypothetical protein ACI4VW_03015 [Acutalibacteraceae bacterium]
MHYGDNKPKYIRWAIFCLLLTSAVLLQNSYGGLTEILGARIFISIPLCVMISMFEREVPAAVFGAFAGALWDVSGGVDGFNTFILMILCAVCSLLISHLMRNNVVTAMALGTGGIAAYEIIYIAVRFWGAGSPLRFVFSFYLPSLLITVPFVPLCYILVRFIYKNYRNAE